MNRFWTPIRSAYLNYEIGRPVESYFSIGVMTVYMSTFFHYQITNVMGKDELKVELFNAQSNILINQQFLRSCTEQRHTLWEEYCNSNPSYRRTVELEGLFKRLALSIKTTIEIIHKEKLISKELQTLIENRHEK